MNLGNLCRVGLLPLMLGTAAACSDMDPGTDTYLSVNNLTPRAGAGGDDGVGSSGAGGNPTAGGSGGSGSGPSDVPAAWACLVNPPPPFQLPMMPPATVNYLVPVIDLNLGTAVPGLAVKLCISESCVPDVPIPAIVQPEPPRPIYLIQIPYNTVQSPYLQLSADGYVTMDYYFGGPMVGNPRPDPDNNPETPAPPFLGNVIPMLRTETLDGLLRDVQAPSPALPGTGVLAVRTLSCTNERAPGVYVEPVQEMPEDIVPWTLSDNNAALRGVNPTDPRGVAGFANVPAGTYRVQGVAPIGGETGTEFGPHTLRVKPGFITLGEVRLGIGQYAQ